MPNDTALEEKVAHLERVCDELSDIVASQGTELSRLSRQVDMLLQREAEKESDAGGAFALTDRRPPHW